MTTYAIRGVPCSMQPCPLRHLHDHEGKPPPMDSATYETSAVLAGAYKGQRLSLKATLTHVVRVNGDLVDAVLCNGVAIDSLADCEADDTSAPATCPRCAKKDPRQAPAVAKGGRGYATRASGRDYVLHIKNGMTTLCNRVAQLVNCAGDGALEDELCRSCVRRRDKKAT